MAPTTYFHCLFTYEQAQEIDRVWRHRAPTGDYHGWENVYTGASVAFSHNAAPPAPTKVKASPRHPKMVDRSQDWKKHRH